MNRMKEKIFVVTGAALGIWRAASVLPARKGARIAVTDIRDQEGGAVAKEITNRGGVAQYWLHPGFIWTPMVEVKGREQPGGVEEFHKHMDHLHPIGHVGEPEDIAYGILCLASDESKFVTGSELVIDGGYTAR
ncbi:MAG TPA: SDR family oxidoreductase [Verrucomicrobiae bacterium]|nr:SDR family oxidoreductase [Verrucomicrobiae bacterium]